MSAKEQEEGGAEEANGEKGSALEEMLALEGEVLRVAFETTCEDPDYPRVKAVSDEESDDDGAAPREKTGPLVGLCLSGGGMRSGTFCLGVLQSLARLGILKKIHYLSTVSGGGYTGGFWSRWLYNRAKQGDLPGPGEFPGADPNESSRREPVSIRHLRAYSNFLSPHPGIFTKDGQRIVFTLLAMMIPALVVVNLLLALMLSGAMWISELARNCWSDTGPWTSIEGTFGYWGWLIPAMAFGVLLLAALVAGRLRQVMEAKSDPPEPRPVLAALFVLFIVTLILGGALGIADVLYLHGKAEASKAGVNSVGSAGILSAIFLLLRRKLFKFGSRVGGSGEGEPGVPAALRETLSRIALNALPWLVILFAAVAMAILVRVNFLEASEPLTWLFWTNVYLLAGVLAFLVLFHPEVWSLHHVYRSRIARAFLGAGWESTEDLERNQTTEDEKDDVTLGECGRKVRNQGHAPIHLICATANDLGGDALLNANYGSRSAVFSPFGFWVDGAEREVRGKRVRRQYLPWITGQGEEERELEMSLSSAMTASAAAFNTQMGHFNRGLSRAVPILMGALNLRLGRWLRSPAFPDTETLRVPKFWGGFYFLKEICSLTRVKRQKYVHISDGGQFENLGLYELVRRRCQYIIVVDADTDPRAASSNIGLAVRRIRTDFGIDIDIDTRALAPDADGLIVQHAVAGQIKYQEGPEGILIYLRPGLIGDESVDILNYRAKDPKFPNQSTGDQFFDEAQWEAYRRLGEHIGDDSFANLGKDDTNEEGEERDISRVFIDALWSWKRPPAAILENLNSVFREHQELVQKIRNAGAHTLVKELFPEMDHVFRGKKEDPAEPKDADKSEEEFLREAQWVREASLVLETGWRRLQIATFGDYPAFQGWRKMLQRWLRLKGFQRVWPILRTLLDTDFARFCESECGRLRNWKLDFAELKTKRSTKAEPSRKALVMAFGEESFEVGELQLARTTSGGDVGYRLRAAEYQIKREFWSFGYGGGGLRLLLQRIQEIELKSLGEGKELSVVVEYATDDVYSGPARDRLYEEAGFQHLPDGQGMIWRRRRP